MKLFPEKKSFFMAKKIHIEGINLAPGIVGWMDNGVPKAYDTDERVWLDLEKVDDKIKIFEKQVKGWFLEVSNMLVVDPHKNGFVILMICLSYFEGIEQMYQGKRTPKYKAGTYFQNAVERVFPQLTNGVIKDILWKAGRNSLFHNGMTGGKIILDSDRENTFTYDGNWLIINPTSIARGVLEHFKSYIADLKNEENVDMRRNFDRMFSNL